MNKQDFINYIEQGYHLIPLHTVLDNIKVNPIDVYESLSDQPQSYLFESIEGGKKWSRYTIIGLPSDDYIEVSNNKLSIKENGSIKNIQTDNPIEWIDSYIKNYKVLTDPNLPEFQGGLVGYFGFDTVRYFESKIKGNSQQDQIKTPDIHLMISKEILIFDKIKNKVYIIIFSHNNLESYNSSMEKLDIILESIKQYTSKELKTPQKIKTKQVDLKYHFSKSSFLSSVKKIKDYIVKGDVMQVVLSQRISMDFNEKPISFYKELRKLNPSPYMYYLNLANFHIIGSSPEILVRLENNLITVRPIAGTRPRGKNQESDKILENELKADPKERAEHLMLIDLGRNDVGKVSKIGSVKLTDEMIIEKYSHVMHMVSNVTGEIKSELGMMDVLKSTFPAGTVSGAPKIRAIEIIYELEPIKRGIYAGAIGYLGWNGNMDTAIAIRTCVIKDSILNVQCGAGIVYDSVPELEWEETINKGQAIVQAYKNLKDKNV
jgi:anthranilate synthase component 1